MIRKNCLSAEWCADRMNSLQIFIELFNMVSLLLAHCYYKWLRGGFTKPSIFFGSSSHILNTMTIQKFQTNIDELNYLFSH